MRKSAGLWKDQEGVEKSGTWFATRRKILILGGKLRTDMTTFDPALTAANWYLGNLNSEHLPAFACEALKQGHEGKNLRTLAGLTKPTKRDRAEIADRAFREVRAVVPLNADEAAQWKLRAVKASASSGEITAENLIGKTLIALPELEACYSKELQDEFGYVHNYSFAFTCLKPAIENAIRSEGMTDFLQRSCAFIERVCKSSDLEATNVLWIEMFEWLVHSPAGELKFLWPSLGPATKATIVEVAQRRREDGNLPAEAGAAYPFRLADFAHAMRMRLVNILVRSLGIFRQ